MKILLLLVAILLVWQSSSKCESYKNGNNKKNNIVSDNLRYVSEQLESLKIWGEDMNVSPRELKKICKDSGSCSNCIIDKKECAHQVSNYRGVNNCNPCFFTEKDIADTEQFRFEFTVKEK